MPPWELKALEYTIGAVLLGLAFVVTTEAPYCTANDPWSDWNTRLIQHDRTVSHPPGAFGDCD